MVSEEWIIEKCKEIYSTLGRGYTENIYHKAFETELQSEGIPYETEKIVPILYKNRQIGFGRADIVLNDIVIEFKAMIQPPRMSEIEQINNYMINLGVKKGIIINFGGPSSSQRDTVDTVIVKKENENIPQENNQENNQENIQENIQENENI